MTDQDFNFAPPPQKRDKPKQFEPPPWEREQFEELERRKAEEKAAEMEATAAARSAVVGEADEGGLPTEPVATREPEGTVRPPGQVSGTAAGSESSSEQTIDAMLVQLKGEEPQVGQGIWKVSLAVSFVVVVIGIAVATVGIVALGKRLGQAGTLGGFVLLTFGIGFIAIGIWVTYQTLRQQGVL